MAIDVDTLEKLRQEPEIEPLDLSWLNLGEEQHWGIRAKPGKRGLTLDEVEIGPTGEVPEQTDNRSMRVRGSVPRADVIRVPETYAYANNHYAGHGPATIRRLAELVEAEGS